MFDDDFGSSWCVFLSVSALIISKMPLCKTLELCLLEMILPVFKVCFCLCSHTRILMFVHMSLLQTGSSLVPSLSASATLTTQPAGVMQSSPVTQQPFPVFRQPAGLHISPYPSSYLHYNQYFSPFFVPPPAPHHFLNNAAFPQQLATGSIYQPPAAGAAGMPVKYPISQYKPGMNTGNSNHSGMPTGYGTYSVPAGYSPSLAVATGNSTASGDLPVPQYKDNNAYISSQQVYFSHGFCWF